LRPNQGTIPAFTWRDYEKPHKPVKIAGVLAEISTEHILNTSLKYYHYTNQLGVNLQAGNKCYLLYGLYVEKSLENILLGHFFKGIENKDSTM
jgi:hypothetical protein